MRFLLFIFLLIGYVSFGQSGTQQTDKLISQINNELKSMHNISIYFIFDTNKDGQIMTKNSYLDIDISCKGNYNDEGRVDFYFKNDSLKFIRLFDYDPVEGSASRETEYYFNKNELLYIHDYSEKYKTSNGADTSNAITRKESKVYLTKNTVVKHQFKTKDALRNSVDKKEFEESPFTINKTLDNDLLINKDLLLDIIRKGWITSYKVKLK